MRRPLLALCALAFPLVAGAHGFGSGTPSIGEALQTMDRIERRQVERRPADPAELEQVFVLPERPGQNQVAWFGFDWHYLDVPAPGGGPGGIRLYYYRTELEQARRALPAIQSAYARLVEAFHYNPTRRIPYILYATQREFQTQNVFQVTESVLGVTSPQDLKMAVPYFGDHSRFIEVSTHELVHQFTIQKLLEAAGAEEMRSPIFFLPLWFIEGIAEYYTKGGIDVETDLYLRDLVSNPDARRGYEILSFSEDRIRGYIPTYKLGQARIAFIAEEYGPERIQAFLENAYLLADGGRGGPTLRGFDGLVRRVLNEPVEQVDARWKAWLKQRYYAEYLRARHDLPQLRTLRSLPAEPEHFSLSPDGTVMLMRGIDRERGRARLYLLDVRDPRSAVEVAADNVPGVESLHPIEYGITAVAEDRIAFSAQSGIGDRLYVQRYRHSYAPGQRARIRLGKRRALDLRAPGGGPFITISYPDFSPDGSQLAFVGVAGDGLQGVYVVPVSGGEARRLTADGFSVKDVSWGPDGIYYASDATEHGRTNLFRVDPGGTGEPTRLTTEPVNDRAPQPQPDGSVLFASDRPGKPDLHVLREGGVQRLTDFTTGLTSPAMGPNGRGILSSTFHGGVFRIVEVPRQAWLEEEAVPVPPAVGTVLPIPVADFPADVPAYDAYALRNWRPEAGFVYGGGAGSAVAGRAAVLFSDILRDHVLFVDLAVYGSFDYTQALVLYENRARRTGYVLGGFHFVQQQLDQQDENLAYYQRDFGLVSALRHPLDRFRRVEAELTLGGVQRYCLTDFRGNVVLVCGGIQTESPVYGGPAEAEGNWRSQNGGVNFTVSPTFRFGYDTIRYHPLTGPIAGNSLLLELGGGYLPGRSAVHGFVRADAQQYWQLIGRSNLSLRFAAGTTFSPNDRSRPWQRSWWLTSADNLRGFYPNDLEFLIGQHYYVANAELQFPLDPLVRLLIFDYIEGVLALDFGGAFNQYGGTDAELPATDAGAWESRTLTGVLGVNVLFGPLLLRVHFGRPFDIGGVETPAMREGANWVTNVTLRYFFF